VFPEVSYPGCGSEAGHLVRFVTFASVTDDESVRTCRECPGIA